MQALIPAQNNLPVEDLTALMKTQWLEINAAERKFNAAINPQKIAFGENLRRMKSQLQHGQWQHWLAENFCKTFNLTDKTAQNYMKVAEYFGTGSPLKNEIDFGFSFSHTVLIVLTKNLTVQEVPKFLSALKESGVDAASLSVTQVQKAIKEWKNPSLPLTVDVQAEITTAPAPKLPRYSVANIPIDLIAAAESAGLNIELNFSRALKLPTADTVLITAQNDNPQFQFYLKVAACVVIAKPIAFICSDEKLRKYKVNIWYFGNDTENFVACFGTFGGATLPSNSTLLTTKNPRAIVPLD